MSPVPITTPREERERERVASSAAIAERLTGRRGADEAGTYRPSGAGVDAGAGRAAPLHAPRRGPLEEEVLGEGVAAEEFSPAAGQGEMGGLVGGERGAGLGAGMAGAGSMERGVEGGGMRRGGGEGFEGGEGVAAGAGGGRGLMSAIKHAVVGAPAGAGEVEGGEYMRPGEVAGGKVMPRRVTTGGEEDAFVDATSEVRLGGRGGWETGTHTWVGVGWPAR